MAAGSGEPHVPEPLGSGGGELMRAAGPVRAPDGTLVGVVVASDFLTGELAARSRRMTEAYEEYNKLKVLKNPLLGVYLSFFLMVTLMILVSATWMGLYLAKRITRPVQTGWRRRRARLARVTSITGSSPRPPTSSARWSRPSTPWPPNCRPAGRSSSARPSTCERQHQEVEARRRYIETILDRITTGVISAGRRGPRDDDEPGGGAGCWGWARTMTGRPVEELFVRPDLQPLAALLDQRAGRARDPPPQEVALARDGRELHLAAVDHGAARRRGRDRGTPCWCSTTSRR